MLVEATNAPGLSAFNKAERRMFHLSKQMTGVVLPHDTFGSHLRNGKTVDEELEKKNFEAAGDTLANLWNDLEIDENPVKAEYIVEPASEEIVRFEVTPSFRSRHVFESQYMTVYMKCDDRTCCSAFRTSVYRFFPHRRMPTLIPISNTSAGLVAMDLEPDMYKKPIKFLSLAQRVVMEEALAPDHLVSKYGKNIPYDAYLPSCQDKVESRTCKVCYKYHATKKSFGMHNKIC